MKFDYIKDQLKEGKTQELLESLENIDMSDLIELANDCMAKAVTPIIELIAERTKEIVGNIVEATKNLDPETLIELIKEFQDNKDNSEIS